MQECGQRVIADVRLATARIVARLIEISGPSSDLHSCLVTLPPASPGGEYVEVFRCVSARWATQEPCSCVRGAMTNPHCTGHTRGRLPHFRIPKPARQPRLCDGVSPRP